MTASARRLWHRYLRSVGRDPADAGDVPVWHFCDNEADANECLDLVLRGVKRATSPALPWLEDEGIPVPEVGDHHVVTDWAGVPGAVIRTARVTVVPFREVTAEHAAIEGEGDGTLAYWRRVHWDYYVREAVGRPYDVTEDMPVVCERFEMVYGVGVSQSDS